MLFSSLSWVMLTLTLLVALPGALASSSPKRTKKSSSTRVTIETYPAMEDGEIIVPREMKITAKSARSNRRVQTLGAPAPVSAPKSAPAQYVTIESDAPKAPAEKFVVVPSEKRTQILQRMHLCETLFQETGRAYDYRSMTTAQLQSELNAVRATERPVAVQSPVTVPDLSVPVNAVPSEPDPILDAQE